MPLNNHAEPKKLRWKTARFALFAAVAGLTTQAALSQQTGPLGPVVSKDDADAAILDRQLVMQDLDHDASVLGDVVAGFKPASELTADAQALAKDAKAAAKSFQVNAPGGNTKPEAWSNWADFSKRLDTFVKNSQALADAAPTVSMSAVGEMMVNAMPCQECHDTYRIDKKKK